MKIIYNFNINGNKYFGYIQQTGTVMFVEEKLNGGILFQSEKFPLLNIPNPPDGEESKSQITKIVRHLTLIYRPYG